MNNMEQLPCISGEEDRVVQATHQGREQRLPPGGINLDGIRSACAIALHMHQPQIPAGGDHLATATVISNLQYMMEHPDIGDNHNAPVFAHCYQRMGEIIPRLVAQGKAPRVMLEYSGTLLHGLVQMGRGDIIDSLRGITVNPDYQANVEWLAAPWGHAVAPSTPVQDYRRHVLAWQQHFADLFGRDALQRVRGFSPSEMALPNHPDVAYEFVKTLVDCGLQWVLVQEHTVEEPETGASPSRPHLPHRLICRNSRGESTEIIAIVKTQGSDTKLVAQMQPWFEAQTLNRQDLAGQSIPPLVTQIADGENGGVMMNEFPPKYEEVVATASHGEVPLINVSEYLEMLSDRGLTIDHFPTLQPLFQKKIWERIQPGDGPERLQQTIEALQQEDHQFHMEGGSWTNDLSWVQGYDNVLGPMEEASARFNEVVIEPGRATDTPQYRNALYHLLCSQTSCYRYWGQGLWTDYGRELCRRTLEILEHDF